MHLKRLEACPDFSLVSTPTERISDAMLAHFPAAALKAAIKNLMIDGQT